jgi:hypothetical protein
MAPFNTRSPQQPSDAGHAKDHWKEAAMRIFSSIRSTLFALVLLAMSAAACAQISLSISFAPPELPVYEQPLCPGEGYLWTPGYWAYADEDYYWVPGTWVMAPQIGFLWTPAYWGWSGNGFVFYDGYWGPQVGFYGGINYGYGYFGEGYEGGRWDHDRFFYNRSVNNVNVTIIHNVYNTTVVNRTVTRVSYNGGNGGISARPRPEEEAAAHERHIPAVAAQTQHAQAARTNPEQRASRNHGTPPVAATPKPGALNDREVVRAKAVGTPYNPPANRPAAQPAANAPAARPENGGAREDRAVQNNQPESKRPPKAEPNTRPDRPDSNRMPTAQPNNRPEPNRNEPAERPQAPPRSEPSQPQHTPPPSAETRRAPQEQQHQQPAARTPEEKRHQDKQPEKEEKPPQ